MIKKELQQELDRTKVVLDYARQEIKDKDKEIERLNNIINELEKYFEQEGFWHSLDKIKELKGVDKK